MSASDVETKTSENMAPGNPSPHRRIAVSIAILTALLAGFAAGYLIASASPAKQGPAPLAANETEKKERRILYYIDRMMNPPYISDKPGKSPMGMDLEPVYADKSASGHEVRIDPVIAQDMGIRTAKAAEGPIKITLRSVGFFREADDRVRDFSLKVGGWIEKLNANTEGMAVKAGDPLLVLYSPDLLIAQTDLLIAQKSLDEFPSGSSKDLRASYESIYESARKKLEFLDMPAQEMEKLLKSGKSSGQVMFRSPASGFIVDKKVVEGASIQPGDKLFRISDLSVLWLDARVYEENLPHVSVGQRAMAEVRGIPGKICCGKVILIDPRVDTGTRRTTVRIEFPNPDYSIKPGMYASVELYSEAAANALLVPREAVIDTGVRQVVYVVSEPGRFAQRNVRTGIEPGDGTVQITEGLQAGETVVTSGQFLIDSESNLREAAEKMKSLKDSEMPPEHSHH